MTTTEPTAISKILPATLEQMAEETADNLGACLRPMVLKRVDNTTGEVTVVPVPCGATRSSVCPACADKARRLRVHQAREGWHLTEEPTIETAEPTAQQRAALGQIADLTEARALAVSMGDERAVAEIDGEIEQAHALLTADGLRGEKKPVQDKKPRKVRSTRRRQDAPDLPRKRVIDTTTGRAFTAPDGTVYRPSTFLTLTLDSYGPVHSASKKPEHPKVCRCGRVHHKDDGIVGTPLDRDSYDYRRAARDAIHFGKLTDRFWQNLRRACGWNVQYFAAVEPQKRLAMHLHAAVRGTIPRKLLRQVVAATYHQVWWPVHDVPVYSPEDPPRWDEQAEAYVDPTTGEPLTSWDDALEDTLAPDAEPAHVVRFGTGGLDVQGVDAGTEKAGKCLGYLVKYITKELDACYEPDTDAARAHLDRLTDALRVEPCSESCANWLLYGIQPADSAKGLTPGCCKGKAHRPANLGYRGRRCLVSKKWSGRNLTEHRAERRDHVLKTLGAIGAQVDMVTADDPDGTRYRWVPIPHDDPNQPDRTQLLLHSIAQQRRWKQQYQEARQAAAELPATEQNAA
jgi:hypothetical protein